MYIDDKNMTLEELRRFFQNKLSLINQILGIQGEDKPDVPINPYQKECPEIIDPRISKIPRSKAERLILQMVYPDYLIPVNVIEIMKKNGIVFVGNQENSVRIDLANMAKNGKIESMFIVEGKKDRMYRMKPDDEFSSEKNGGQESEIVSD